VLHSTKIFWIDNEETFPEFFMHFLIILLGLPAFLEGVPRQLSGRAFRYIFFTSPKRRIKKGYRFNP